MTRLLLALIAIAALALSAEGTHGRLVAPNSAPAYTIQALAARPPRPALELAPPARPLAPASGSSDDAPQPALLVYLALVVIGGVVAVGMVRREARAGD
jgi:hypothetical protein